LNNVHLIFTLGSNVSSYINGVYKNVLKNKIRSYLAIPQAKVFSNEYIKIVDDFIKNI